MTLPSFLHDDTGDDAGDETEGLAPETATVLDLTAGVARITTAWNPQGDIRYSIDLPDGPLTPDDTEYLAAVLHPSPPATAVLIDIEEYAEPE